MGAVAVLLIVLFAPVPAHAQDALAEVFASDATVRGSVLLVGSGTKVLSGSSVSAGAQPALVRLARGGEVRVCAGNSVTLASATGGRELLWGVGTGAIEVHYALQASSDTLMTPDFRILLAGPGAFHFALSSDNRGNTCVRSLPGATASVIVQELAASGSYQVRPGDQVLFRNGRMSEADSTTPLSCGCPPPAPLHRAEKPVQPKPVTPPEEKETAQQDEPPALPAPTPPPPAAKPHVPPALATSASPAPAASTPPAPAASALPAAQPAASAVKSAVEEVAPDVASSARRPNPLAGLPPPSPAEVTAPLPEPPPGAIQIQVDAPFVFQAADPLPGIAPLVARVSLGSLPQWPAFEPLVRPPPAPPPPPQAKAEPPPKPKKKKGGFFGFFRAIFASIFGKR